MALQSVLAGALASVFVTAFLADTASADMRIVNDPGGKISSYVLTFKKMRAAGERVVIDGPCLSQSTLRFKCSIRSRAAPFSCSPHCFGSRTAWIAAMSSVSSTCRFTFETGR